MKMVQIYSELISYHRNAAFFMRHKQGGDEVEGLLSAKFEEEIKRK